jgi:regulator of protease activity HflC (stomatin/prohibitin superfamily)
VQLYEIVVVVVVVAALWASRSHWPRPQTVHHHQRALRYRNGRLTGELGPGRYWLRPTIDRLETVDVRRRQTIVAGQEVLTADRVPLKVSLVAEYSVVDVVKALTEVAHYETVLYTHIQLALRQTLADVELDVALAERGDLGAAIRNMLTETAVAFGVEVHDVQVRDFMMSGGLKSAFADIILEKQRGLAALERARGETAALRSLANAAELLERHPGMMRLRLLQAVEGGTGNRIVINLDAEPDNDEHHD